MKKEILATGLSGLVGTRIQELLSDYYDFTDVSLTTNIDITHEEDVERIFTQSQTDTVLHMAAKTDVDSCEDDKILGDEGAAWVVNVIGTQNVVSAAKKTGKRLIYISTDFVFDGTKEFYTEEDEPNPVCWYAVTKFEGEKIVLSASSDATVIRISYPYLALSTGKKDFVQRIREVLASGKEVRGLTDHVFTPTFIDDIAFGLRVFLDTPNPGIFHLVGSSSMTSFEGLHMIAKAFQLPECITATTRKDYFRGRAFRPFQLALKNGKIRKLGITPSTFAEGLDIIKKQLHSQKSG
jgi:dTDP-4-dehydrorhamnose reductase